MESSWISSANTIADSTNFEGVGSSKGGIRATNTENSATATTIEPAILDEHRSQQEHRFYDFRQRRVPSKLQTAFVAGTKRRDLLPKPVNYRQLAGHAFEKELRENMACHIRQQREQFKSWEIVSGKEATGHQVLGCQWMFKYKTDKHNKLQKCKARLAVCGNQQREHDLPTRATTLATTSEHPEHEPLRVGGFVHDMDKLYTAEDVAAFGDFEHVPCLRGQVRVTKPEIVHGSTTSTGLRIRRTIMPCYVGVQDIEKGTPDVEECDDWDSLCLSHMHQTVPKNSPSGHPIKYGKLVQRFPFSTQLPACSQVVLEGHRLI